MQRIVKLCLAAVLLAGTADAIAIEQRRGGSSKGRKGQRAPQKGRGRQQVDDAPTLEVEVEKEAEASGEESKKGGRGRGRGGRKNPGKFVEHYIEKECPDSADPVACEAAAEAFGTDTLDALVDASCEARFAIKQAICTFKQSQDATVTCDDLENKCDEDDVTTD